MISTEQRIIITKLLGTPKDLNNNQLLFKCPFCKHHKKKLQVHMELGQWHCWVCQAKGRSLHTLLTKLGIVDRVILDKFRTHKNTLLDAKKKEDSEPLKEFLTLPSNFKPLANRLRDPHYTNALGYVLKRGLTGLDILKYNIGYCDSGRYSGMIIIPSYDSEGNLNFFTGRSFYDSEYKHKNPSWSKDIIGFEMFINWNEPITIVEGPFDAIAVKRNAIPLFGKKILPKLKETILLRKVKDLHICLDKDAKADALKNVNYFSANGVNVHFVELNKKDPSEIGFNEITKTIAKTKTVDFSDLIRLKLSI